MAFTAHKDDKMMEELNETPEDVEAKARQLADMLRASKHAVFFTGAGISTSAGIPDFRGPQGVWTLAAKGEQPSASQRQVRLEAAVPTKTHMALVELMRLGLVKHLISQNVDGMHRKSGIPVTKLSELHGNCNLEVCDGCKREFLRDFHTRSAQHHLDHETGSMCPACGGKLRDNIVNFGENLPVGALHGGFANSAAADLHVVLGSSLTVRPACNMPQDTAEKGGKLVIVNLQRTPLDDAASLRVHAPCDVFMCKVMEHLGIAIPEFELQRRAVLWREGDNSVRLAGVDANDTQVPASLFPRVVATVGEKSTTLTAEPHCFSCPTDAECSVTVSFFGHYVEPDATLVLAAGQQVAGYLLRYRPSDPEPKWTITPDSALQPPKESAAAAAVGAGEGQGAATVASTAGHGATDYSGWFAVTPKAHCPHLANGVVHSTLPTIDLNAPCNTKDCANVGENMLCLGCGTVFCGRHVHGHMLAHYDEHKHPVVSGFADLTFWCYECDHYIAPSNRSLRPVYAALHTAKFGVPPPGWTARDCAPEHCAPEP